MFYGAESFNQNISSWDLSGGTTFVSNTFLVLHDVNIKNNDYC